MKTSCYIGRAFALFRNATAMLLLTPFFSSCTPSEGLIKEYALYNFTDEGYLTHDVVQTRGTAIYRPLMTGNRGIRRVCTDEATRQAKERMLSIFLHTHFGLKAISRGYSSDGKQFERDYPHKFSDSDLIKAEIEFEPILNTGFIALQDTRSAEECVVVFRIIQKNILSAIKDHELTFTPEGLQREYSIGTFYMQGKKRENRPQESPRVNGQNGSGPTDTNTAGNRGYGQISP